MDLILQMSLGLSNFIQAFFLDGSLEKNISLLRVKTMRDLDERCSFYNTTFTSSCQLLQRSFIGIQCQDISVDYYSHRHVGKFCFKFLTKFNIFLYWEYEVWRKWLDLSLQWRKNILKYFIKLKYTLRKSNKIPQGSFSY